MFVFAGCGTTVQQSATVIPAGCTALKGDYRQLAGYLAEASRAAGGTITAVGEGNTGKITAGEHQADRIAAEVRALNDREARDAQGCP